MDAGERKPGGLSLSLREFFRFFRPSRGNGPRDSLYTGGGARDSLAHLDRSGRFGAAFVFRYSRAICSPV